MPIKHRWRLHSRLFDGKKETSSSSKQLSGDDVVYQVYNLGGLIFGKGVKRKCDESTNWLKKSIFFELSYWRTLLLRHNLDAMHIEKNVCDSVIGTLMNIKGKTKDNFKSCLDLQARGIREELHPIPHGEKMLLPSAYYTLSTDEKRVFCEFLTKVKFPDGYSSNIAR